MWKVHVCNKISCYCRNPVITLICQVNLLCRNVNSSLFSRVISSTLKRNYWRTLIVSFLGWITLRDVMILYKLRSECYTLTGLMCYCRQDDGWSSVLFLVGLLWIPACPCLLVLYQLIPDHLLLFLTSVQVFEFITIITVSWMYYYVLAPSWNTHGVIWANIPCGTGQQNLRVFNVQSCYRRN